jgi:Tol biopolymer transport system component
MTTRRIYLASIIMIISMLVACSDATPRPTQPLAPTQVVVAPTIFSSQPTSTQANSQSSSSSTIEPTPKQPATPQPTATPEPTVLYVQMTNGGCCVQPYFAPDGTRVLYIDKPDAASPTGVWSVRIDAPQKPELYREELGPYSRDLSMRIFLEGGRTTVERVSDKQRWTIPNQGRIASFSPDSRLLAWSVSEEIGGFDRRKTDIYIANFDGSDARKVATRYGGGSLGWFGDSQRLLLGGRPNRADDKPTLSILNLADGSARDLISMERLRGASLSPDGKRLIYFVAQAVEDGLGGVYLLNLDTTQAKRLDFFGAYRWRDSNRLFYIPLKQNAPSNELWQLDATTLLSERLIGESPDSLFKIANGDWDISPDGSMIVYLNARDRNVWLAKLR